MNNLKVKEDLNDIKCEILKQHSHLTSQFKRYIKNLKDSIEQIEKSIE